MDTIQVLEKPESISFDEIHRVLWDANRNNREKGFELKTASMSGQELKARIGEKGKCFIAVDGNRIVGTLSARILQKNTWYYTGELVDYMLAGVIPEYQGKHINTMLANLLFSFAKDNHYSAIELDTAADNNHAINVYKHQGFIPVDFVAKKNLDHYSVIMMKWLDKCPYSLRYIKFRYDIKRLAVLVRYKKGKIKRFGI